MSGDGFKESSCCDPVGFSNKGVLFCCNVVFGGDVGKGNKVSWLLIWSSVCGTALPGFKVNETPLSFIYTSWDNNVVIWGNNLFIVAVNSAEDILTPTWGAGGNISAKADNEIDTLFKEINKSFKKSVVLLPNKACWEAFLSAK